MKTQSSSSELDPSSSPFLKINKNSIRVLYSYKKTGSVGTNQILWSESESSDV